MSEIASRSDTRQPPLPSVWKTYNLEVHHLAYKDEYGASIVGRELEYLDKLILLCDVCHQNVHESK